MLSGIVLCRLINILKTILQDLSHNIYILKSKSWPIRSTYMLFFSVTENNLATCSLPFQGVICHWGPSFLCLATGFMISYTYMMLSPPLYLVLETSEQRTIGSRVLLSPGTEIHRRYYILKKCQNEVSNQTFKLIIQRTRNPETNPKLP